MPRLVAPAVSRLPARCAQAVQIEQALTLDEAIAWNVKELGYGG